MARTYRCPVCGKPLSKSEYERALQIHEAKKKHLAEREEALVQRERELPKKVAAAKRAGAQEGTAKERARANRLMVGQRATIHRLEDRVRQLEKGSTPQTEGLEFEDKLAGRLHRVVPKDGVKQVRKGGDILHTVRADGKVAGLIIYECKREPRIKTTHVRQAYLAKQRRQAHFAVLVTTGSRKGFTGLSEMQGVLLVAPLGAIPLASLLREYLLAMHKPHVTKSKRALMAEQLVKFIRSPEFKNPIEDVIGAATDLQDMVVDEAKVHVRIWQKRRDYYQRIVWDSTHIQSNVLLVLEGKEPEQAVFTKPAPLQLPAVTGR